MPGEARPETATPHEAMAPSQTSIDLDTATGPIRLRPEGPADEAFLFMLFRSHMLAELALMPVDAPTREALVRMQFQSQTASYRTGFQNARFDIIEVASQDIGRIVVDEGGDTGCIVDFALLPEHRGQGRGSAILAAVLQRAARVGRPVRCKVLMHNEPSIRMCARVGFRQIDADPPFLQLEWRADA